MFYRKEFAVLTSVVLVAITYFTAADVMAFQIHKFPSNVCVVGTHYIRLNETILMSTYNIGFDFDSQF